MEWDALDDSCSVHPFGGEERGIDIYIYIITYLYTSIVIFRRIQGIYIFCLIGG
jgi:hypothetical protein